MQKKKAKKIQNIIYYILGFVIIVMVAMFLVANFYLDNIVEKELKSLINQNPKSIYKVEFQALNVGILNKSITLKNVTIIPEKFAIDSLNSGKIKTLVQIEVDVLLLRGVGVFEYLENKDIKIKKIKVKGIKSSYLINPEVKSAKVKTSLPSQNIFSKDFSGASIQDFEIKDLSILVSDNTTMDQPWIEVNSLSFYISDVVFDKYTVEKKFPISFSNLKLNTKNFSYKSMEYYDISTSDLSFNMNDSSIVLDNFIFQPKFSKKIYNKKIKYENDLFSVSTEKIKLIGFSLNDLILNNSLRLNSIEILKPEIEISRNKNLPDKPYKYKPLLANLIKKIPIKLFVDSLLITDGSLSYMEKQHLTEDYGEVNFDPLDISVHNITNDPEILKKNKHMNLFFSGKLMGKGNINAELSFDLSSTVDNFTAKGNLGAIKGFEFNKMIKNLLLVEIKMGDIHWANFDFWANDNVSQGNIKIVYENLQVEIYKTKKSNKQKKFVSYVANKTIRKNNLPDGNNYRIGTIYFERDKNKALPNYLWKSIQTGVISVIAPVAENKQQKEIKKKKRKAKKTKSKN